MGSQQDTIDGRLELLHEGQGRRSITYRYVSKLLDNGKDRWIRSFEEEKYYSYFKFIKLLVINEKGPSNRG